MRKLSTILIPATLAGLVAATMPAGAASARTVPPELFGQHIGSVVSEVPSTLTRVGAVRLWDSGVTWRELEPVDDQYRWDLLRSALDNIEGRFGPQVEVMFTLGNTPLWAASVKDSSDSLYGPGANSHPEYDDYYLDFLKDLIAEFGPRIDSYQIWNEANLRDFYLGTPKQLADLTVLAGTLIKQLDPSAVRVAASTTVRANGPVGKFGKAYGAAMKKARAWRSVDAVSAHFYPPANKGPAERVKYIKKIKKYYKKYGAGKKPLWDTEMNFGDTRDYMTLKRWYKYETARTYVARAFIDSMRYGVSRVFWYGWDIHMLGTDMTARDSSEGVSAGQLTPGGKAFLEIQDWMVGKPWGRCTTKASITTCKVGGSTIRYAAKKKTLTMPAGSWQIRRLDGSSTVVEKGAKVPLTAEPILISKL